MVHRRLSLDSPVDDQGNVQFGVHTKPFRHINLDQARLRWLGRPRGRQWAEFRLKEWQHYGLILPEMMVGFAVVDAKFLATSWCHVVERTYDVSDHGAGSFGDHFEHARQGPFLKRNISRELWDDSTFLQASGYEIRVQNHLDRGEHRIYLDIEAGKAGPAVRGDLRCIHDLEVITPLVAVLPVGENRALYTHKVALPIEGTLEVGDRSLSLDPDVCVALLDIHKAHYPHHTWWNWATFAGRDGQGRWVALNLTRNMIRADERWNENALWVDGRLIRLPAARFDFDKRRVLEPWRLHTTDAAVDLTFRPAGQRSQRLNLGILKSSFNQPYGVFSGTVRCGEETLAIEDMVGVCEDHDARW
jgi:hypothetical protein